MTRGIKLVKIQDDGSSIEHWVIPTGKMTAAWRLESKLHGFPNEKWYDNGYRRGPEIPFDFDAIEFGAQIVPIRELMLDQIILVPGWETGKIIPYPEQAIEITRPGVGVTLTFYKLSDGIVPLDGTMRGILCGWKDKALHDAGGAPGEQVPFDFPEEVFAELLKKLKDAVYSQIKTQEGWEAVELLPDLP